MSLKNDEIGSKFPNTNQEFNDNEKNKFPSTREEFNKLKSFVKFEYELQNLKIVKNFGYFVIKDPKNDHQFILTKAEKLICLLV